MNGQVAQLWVWAVSVVCVGCLPKAAFRFAFRENTVRSRDLKEAAARAQSLARTEFMACRGAVECYFRSDDFSR